VTLEEGRQRRECFVLVSALVTMFDPFAADLMRQLARLYLQGTAALPSFLKSCSSITALSRIIRA